MKPQVTTDQQNRNQAFAILRVFAPSW